MFTINKYTIKTVLFFALLGACLQAYEQHTEAFDEVFQVDGSPREAYEGIVPLLEGLKPKGLRGINKKTFQDFKKEYRLSHIPRMLTAGEMTQLEAGTNQRARALHAFALDHYSGNKEYLKQRIIPQSVMSDILKRSGESDLEGFVNPDSINFWYGPDVIRGPDGQFHVVEDNPGYIGGIGDLMLARQSLLQHFPKLDDVIDSPDPAQFFDNMVATYRSRVRDDEAIVLLRYPNAELADKEDLRTHLTRVMFRA